MKIGKLTNDELSKLVLSKITPHRDDVVLRPGIGVDCGGIQMGDDVCILSTDPITAAAENAGRLAVHISCNDAAAAGAEPVGLLLTIMAPPDGKLEDISSVIEQAQRTAAKLNVEIIGGHTEVTDAVNRLILSATVVGKAKGGKFFSAANAKPGDAIILTKWAGMEGTAIIASDFYDRIEGVLSEEELDVAKSLSEQISVVPEGLLARDLPVSAMHDVTEGGILGALWEMCHSSGCGALVDLDRVPMLDITFKLCNHLSLDPMRLISSGCMLISASDGDEVLSALLEAGIPSTIIGKMKIGPVMATKGGSARPVEPPERDELYKLFG